MKKIGFIGIGVMGTSMVKNLLTAGFDVTVYSRTKSKADDVLQAGAVWANSPAECAKGQDAVITIVGFPKDVEEVYFGAGGVLEGADAGAYLIDMTTTSPKLSVRIYEEAKAKGLYAIDAPVSGGDVGAQKGTLSIMAGGDKEAVDACMEIFSAMGNNIIYEGPAGAGQHTKAANQIAIAGALSGVCEALSYAEKVGLNQQTVLDSISAGAAGSWQMSNMAPRMLKGDFAPGFFVKHYIKDMSIAIEESGDRGFELPVSKLVLGLYQELLQEGLGDCGTQALLKYYEKK